MMNGNERKYWWYKFILVVTDNNFNNGSDVYLFTPV